MKEIDRVDYDVPDDTSGVSELRSKVLETLVSSEDKGVTPVENAKVSERKLDSGAKNESLASLLEQSMELRNKEASNLDDVAKTYESAKDVPDMLDYLIG